MFSPRNVEEYEPMFTTPDRNNIISTPLRAIASPFYEAVKSAQNKATRDFDRFYENLQAKLSPRTSEARIKKRTPETTEKLKNRLQQRKSELETPNNRTSLTPLIERHTLRDDARARYQYRHRNPFSHEDVESVIEGTPSLTDHDEDDTPLTRPASERETYKPTLLKNSNTPTASNSNMPTASNSNGVVFEEKRLDVLIKKINIIRRQSSILAEHMSSNLVLDHDEDSDDDMDLSYLIGEDEPFTIPSTQPKNSPVKESPKKELPKRDLFSTESPNRDIYQRQSSNRDIFSRESPKRDLVSRESPRKDLVSRESPRRDLVSRESPRKEYSTEETIVHHSPHIISPSTHRFMTSPNKNISPQKNISPRRNIIHELNHAKLRSTETIRTPGGSRVINRFWQEIHGLNAKRESTPGRINKRTPIAKRISTLQENMKKSFNSQTWASDDDFWSSEPEPIPNSFNHKLLKVAQEPPDLVERRTSPNHSLFDDDVESLYRHKLFKSQKEALERSQKEVHEKPKNLFDEIESATKRDEIMKRNNIPKIYPNVLAELKAKHRDKLIDDSDSYKFS